MAWINWGRTTCTVYSSNTVAAAAGSLKLWAVSFEHSLGMVPFCVHVDELKVDTFWQRPVLWDAISLQMQQYMTEMNSVSYTAWESKTETWQPMHQQFMAVLCLLYYCGHSIHTYTVHAIYTGTICTVQHGTVLKVFRIETTHIFFELLSIYPANVITVTSHWVWSLWMQITSLPLLICIPFIICSVWRRQSSNHSVENNLNMVATASATAYTLSNSNIALHT